MNSQQHNWPRPYSPETLAERWECSAEHIRAMYRRGELTGFQLGKLIRIPAEEVERIECQNIVSNASADHTPVSGETMPESDTGSGYTRPTGLARRRKLGADGSRATVHAGPWEQS
jgi:excisionase family DNA binding protein